MFDQILHIINSSSKNEVKSGTLFCYDYVVSDKGFLSILDNKNCFEQTIYIEDLNKGETLDLELSLHKLESLGFYYNFESFIIKNRYQIPEGDYYIYELKCSNTEEKEELKKHKTIISLISTIQNIAKHKFNDIDVENAIIYREDKSVFLPLIYSSTDISLITSNIEKINTLTETLNERNTEKKLLFINELIDFLITEKEDNRFQYLLVHFSEFYEKCNNSYQFYLSGFSDNKLKIELDSKALEYTQKIQSVINDSQTKLIAIPTAFVLVFAAFDFTNLFEIKNIATMISLFIFAVIIQLFLNNQKSTLNFIWENIKSYKEIFNKNDIEKISTKFSLVEKELKIQRNRLQIVEFILWIIPISLVLLWLFLIKYVFISNVIKLLFLIISDLKNVFL